MVITQPCKITSTGTVRRTGAANAVRLSGLGTLTIEKGGLIERTNTGGQGHSVLRVDNRDLTAVNRGTIRSTGTRVIGVELTGSNTNDGTFENWGTVETQGNSSTGIRISAFNGNGGERNTVINRGLISTRGTESSGILSHFSANTKDTKIINFGRILVAGNGSNGIAGWDENVEITLEPGSLVRSTGTTHTSGGFDTESTGLAVSGSNAKVNIKAGATVETTGNKSMAVQLSYDSATARVGAATLTVGGTVRATGANSFGIRGFHDDATIDIKAGGLVETTGASSSALYFGWEGQAAIGGRFPTFTVGIAGTVRATGGGESYAIKGHNSVEKITVESTGVIRGNIDLGGNPDTLIIRPGARIFGRIHLGAGTDVLKYGEEGSEVGFGRGQERTFLRGADGGMSQTFKYTVYGVQGATGDTQPAVIRDVQADGATGPALGRALAGDAAHGAHAAVAGRALALSGPSGAFADAGGGWAAGFGSLRRRTGGDFEHRRSSGGAVAGWDTAFGGWRLGFAAGGWFGKASAGAAAVEASGSGFFGGVYGGRRFGSFAASGAVTAGLDRIRTRRGVAAVDNETAGESRATAAAKRGGPTVGVSLGLAHRSELGGGFELRPRLLASWSWLRQRAAKESGAAESNLKTAARSDRVLALDGGAGLARAFAGGAGEYELRAGFAWRSRTGSPAKLSLVVDPDKRLSQKVSAGRSEAAALLGAGVRYRIGASSGVEAGLDYGFGKGSALSGGLAFNARF